jgi:hypothetical protein
MEIANFIAVDKEKVGTGRLKCNAFSVVNFCGGVPSVDWRRFALSANQSRVCGTELWESRWDSGAR